MTVGSYAAWQLRRFSHAHDKAKPQRAALLDASRVAGAMWNCTDVFDSGKYPDMRLWTPPPADPLLELIRAHYTHFWPAGNQHGLGTLLSLV